MASDTPVLPSQLVLSCAGAGISPIKKRAFGLAPLKSSSDIPGTVIVDEPLLNRNCNNGARTDARPEPLNRWRSGGSPVHSLGRRVAGVGRRGEARGAGRGVRGARREVRARSVR